MPRAGLYPAVAYRPGLCVLGDLVRMVQPNRRAGGWATKAFTPVFAGYVTRNARATLNLHRLRAHRGHRCTAKPVTAWARRRQRHLSARRSWPAALPALRINAFDWIRC